MRLFFRFQQQAGLSVLFATQWLHHEPVFHDQIWVPCSDGENLLHLLQVIEESAARAAGAPSQPGTPGKAAKSPRAGADAAMLAAELADVKKRFLAVAKKKQAEYAKKVRTVSFSWCIEW